MAAWIAIGPVLTLKNAFKTRFPIIPAIEYGTIGNQAHQEGTSDHNADEEGHSEQTDSDNINEVRALDVGSRQITNAVMLAVIMAIFASPLRVYIRYIIFDGFIYHATLTGFTRREYDGPDQHTTHAHFSIWARFDTANPVWTPVLEFGEEMALTDPDIVKIGNEVWFRDTDPDKDVTESAWVALHKLRDDVTDIKAAVAAIPPQQPSTIDYDALAKALLANIAGGTA